MLKKKKSFFYKFYKITKKPKKKKSFFFFGLSNFLLKFDAISSLRYLFKAFDFLKIIPEKLAKNVFPGQTLNNLYIFKYFNY